MDPAGSPALRPRLFSSDGPDIAVGGRLQPCRVRTRSMPRQRIHHSRVTYQVPHDFPERLEQLRLVSNRRSHSDSHSHVPRAPRYFPTRSRWGSR